MKNWDLGLNYPSPVGNPLSGFRELPWFWEGMDPVMQGTADPPFWEQLMPRTRAEQYNLWAEMTGANSNVDEHGRTRSQFYPYDSYEEWEAEQNTSGSYSASGYPNLNWVEKERPELAAPQSGGGYTNNYYYPSYGYGGGGGYADETPVPDPLGELNWWGPDALLPMVRPWGTWLRDLIQKNKQFAIPTFWTEHELPEGESPLEVAETRVSGTRTDRQFFNSLMSRLGLEFTDDESETQRWQRTIDALLTIPANDITTQQMLSSLRYDPTNGWYTADLPMIQNTMYL